MKNMANSSAAVNLEWKILEGGKASFSELSPQAYIHVPAEFQVVNNSFNDVSAQSSKLVVATEETNVASIKSFSFKQIAILIGIVCAFVVALQLYTNFSASQVAALPHTEKTVTVMKGDSLWSIASNLNDDANDLSLPQIVEQIKNMNHLDSNVIHEGQELTIPIYK